MIVAYENIEQTIVSVVDGREAYSGIVLAGDNHMAERVRAWIDAGNTPDAYVPPPPPVPSEISDFQFAAALMARAVITAAEASAFVKVGEIPAALQTAIDAIPDAQARAMAELRVSGATTYRRDHPLTAALAAALGWSSADVDDLWREAAAL